MTWDAFLENCRILKEAGETAVIGTYADNWTAQVPLLADWYNVNLAEPILWSGLLRARRNLQPRRRR